MDMILLLTRLYAALEAMMYRVKQDAGEGERGCEMSVLVLVAGGERMWPPHEQEVPVS